LRRAIGRAETASSRPRVVNPTKAAADHAIKLYEDRAPVAADGKIV